MGYNVCLFTLNGCGYCTTLKEELVKNDITYSEYEVNEHKQTYDQILAVTKEDALPTIYMQNPNTGMGPIIVPGRDFKSPEEANQKIKKYL